MPDDSENGYRVKIGLKLPDEKKQRKYLPFGSEFKLLDVSQLLDYMKISVPNNSEPAKNSIFCQTE